MKKGLIFLLGIVSFLGINTVSADTTYTYEVDTSILTNSTIDEVKQYFIDNKTVINSLYERLYNYYSKNYKESYPYFNFGAIPVCTSSDSLDTCTKLNGVIYLHSDIPTANYISNGDNKLFAVNKHFSILISYDFNTNLYSDTFTENKESSGAVYAAYVTYLHSNFNLNVNTVSTASVSFDTKPSSGNPLTLYNGDTVPTLNTYLGLNLFSESISTYQEINLNNYSYVALSLKDYTQRDTFYTNVFVKGNYCITPVYNYGMTEKGEYYSGYQVDRCSTYYDTFTSIRTYILEQDIENYAIYYVKAYDTSKENIIKVDTSVFDISFISEENKNNPYVSIGGKNYPTISYDSLSSSATKSEDEDYVSGTSCQVGDFNCYNEYNPNNVFQELFDKPLEMLQSVWNAIVTIFNLITEFIALLPPPMQGFLYTAFGITIILGIIKVLI